MDRFSHRRALFPLTLDVMSALKVPLAFVVFGLSLLDALAVWLNSSTGLGFASLMLQAMWIYAVHRVLLTQGRAQGWAAMSSENGKISWKFVGFLLLSVIPAVGITMLYMFSGAFLGEFEDLRDLLPLVAVAVLSYGATLVVFGTVFPSIADSGDANIGDAVRRGMRNAGPIILGLVIGPLPIQAVSILGVFWLAEQGIPVEIVDSFETFSAVGTFVTLFDYLLNSVSMALTAVILCKAYRTDVDVGETDQVFD